MDKAARGIAALLLAFVVLCVVSVLGVQGAGASRSPRNGLDDGAPTPTITPVDLRTCQVGGRQADYSQTGQGITILPYEQHDVGGYNLWETTWRVTGPAGRAIVAQVVTYRCIGLARTPEWDHCLPDRAVETMTHTVSLTIPVSGTADFAVQSPVDCCEIDENDLLSVNGVNWATSFFVRWAESRRCPLPGPSTTPTESSTPTPTSTPTLTPTPTATATNTSTPTPTATPLFHKWPWHEELQPGYSQRYNITLQNTTGSLMAGVVVSDVIPDGARFSDATIVVTGTTVAGDFTWYPSGGAWDGNRTVVWHVGDLPPGYYASMKVHVYAYSFVQPGTILTNTAWFSSGEGPAISARAASLIVATPATPTLAPTPTFTPTPLCPPAPLALVDAGSSLSYTDGQGAVWQPDRAYPSGTNTWGYVGESGTYATSDPILGTGDSTLYQTERYWTGGGGGYRFVVPNGSYEVLLKFAEIYPYTTVGARVFTVRVEGVDVLAHFDVLEIAGANVAYDMLLPAQVTDGLLAVDVIAEQGYPALKAIAVLLPRACTPTPSPTPSRMATATATATPSATATETVTVTPTATASETPTATATAIATATASETAMPTLTASATPTATPQTPTETATPPPSPTSTMTYLPTKTATPRDAETPTATATLSPVVADTPTATATASATATETAETATATPTLPPTVTTHVILLPIIINGSAE